MFGFIKKCFCTAMTVFGCNVLSANPWKCVSINNQESRVRPKIINVDSNDLYFILAVLK